MPDSTESPLYHVTHHGEQREPMSEAQILDCIQQGTLKHTDYCWREGMTEWEELQVIFAETLAEIPPPLPKRTPIALPPSPSQESDTFPLLPKRTAAAPPPLPSRKQPSSGPPPLPPRKLASNGSPPLPGHQGSNPQAAPASTDGTVRFFYWKLKRSTSIALLTIAFASAFGKAGIQLLNERFQKRGYTPGPIVLPEIKFPTLEDKSSQFTYPPLVQPTFERPKIPSLTNPPAEPQPLTDFPSVPQESPPIAESSKSENQPKPFKGLSLKTEEPEDQPETPKLTQDDQGEEAYQRAIIRQLPDKSFGKDGAKWLMMAAEAGHVKAQFFLSQCYYRADGVQRDDLLTVYWLKQAAEAGLPSAQRSLGRFYEQGLCGLVKDENIAAAWLRRAEKAE